MFKGKRNELWREIAKEMQERIVEPVLGLCFSGEIGMVEMCKERALEGVLNIVESVWMGSKTKEQVKMEIEIE